MTATLENATLDIKNRSHTITAEIEIPQETAQGVIVAQGGRFAGWSLYVKDGKLKYCYNWLNREALIPSSQGSTSGRQSHRQIRLQL